MIDVMKHMQYCFYTAAAVLVAFILVQDSATVTPTAFLVVSLVIYGWGSLVGWRVSLYIYQNFAQDYHRHSVLNYVVWFGSWLGVVGLLLWLSQLQRKSGSAKQTLGRVKQEL